MTSTQQADFQNRFPDYVDSFNLNNRSDDVFIFQTQITVSGAKKNSTM